MEVLKNLHFITETGTKRGSMDARHFTFEEKFVDYLTSGV
jgi:hypothetical protein